MNSRGGKPKYPWDAWIRMVRKRKTRFVRGKDYDAIDSSFAQAFREEGWARGMLLLIELGMGEMHVSYKGRCPKKSRAAARVGYKRASRHRVAAANGKAKVRVLNKSKKKLKRRKA